MVLDPPSLISGAAEKLRFQFEYLNSNVPLCEDLVMVRNLINKIANMGGQEILYQFWNSSLEAMNPHSHDTSTGVGYQIGSDGLSFIENLLMLSDYSSAPTRFVLLYNHWCQLCLAKYESHVKLGERVPQMVGTSQIKLGKPIMRPDGDFTWQSKNCSIDCLPYRTTSCNFTPTDPSSTSLRGSSLVFLMGFYLVPYDHGHQCS
ncbi:uncharacterized protein LOC133726019 [Rosa rugosa]|uniref:uncharacterized protein LOC133726019 n=1 Tax=Rosa rugosa TaxID=74645 RepID=UPI002B4038E8|nr:uncharacterized protein LOC133726019 [Rosa rugosa]